MDSQLFEILSSENIFERCDDVSGSDGDSATRFSRDVESAQHEHGSQRVDARDVTSCRDASRHSDAGIASAHSASRRTAHDVDPVLRKQERYVIDVDISTC